MFERETEEIFLKRQFCQYLQIALLPNITKIHVNANYAPAIIHYQGADYAFIDTVLCCVVKKEDGQFYPQIPT